MYKNKVEIEMWLEKMRIKNYIIRDDLSVDINGPVDIFGIGIKDFPIQFGVIKGVFNCGCNSLTSFKGSPRIVLGHANYIHNYITSLEYSPHIIDGNFICDFNKMESLKYSPKKINGNFSLLKTPVTELNLDDLPSFVEGQFIFSHLKKVDKIKFFENKYENEVLTLKLEDIKSILLDKILNNKSSSKRIIKI